jgi:hypothetical protein
VSPTFSNEPAGRVIVIVPCSAAKLAVDRPTPARHLYTGSYHHMCQRAAERIAGPAGVLVLSALHGFVRLDDELLPYEQRMDAPGHVSVEQLRAQAARLDVLAARDMVALGGRAYVDAVTAVRPDALRPLDGCRGIGEQRSRLARLAAADDPLGLARTFAACPAPSPPR